MKSVKYTIYILVLLLATGCSHNGFKTAVVKTKFVSSNNTVHLPLLVDIAIDDSRVTSTFTCSTDYGLEYAKTQAVATALKKSNADILYEPMYQIENTGRIYNVEVTGHPAHYKNFRQASSAADSSAIVPKANIVQPLPVQINSKTKSH